MATESVKVVPVKDSNLVKVNMTITKGKLLAILNALDENPTAVRRDVANMLWNATTKAEV